MLSNRICERCGKTYSKPENVNWSAWSRRRFCGRQCGSEASAEERFGSLLPLCACGCGKRVRARASRYIGAHKPEWRDLTTTGYIRLWRPGHPLASKAGFIQEHRYILHEAGIAIPEGFVVHHINGDRTDNRLENLQVMTSAQHSLHHVLERGSVTNQYGTFPIIGREARREKERLAQRDRRRRAGYVPAVDFLERGRPVHILIRWNGKGPRNVLIEREDGSRVVRPFRGLRRAA